MKDLHSNNSDNPINMDKGFGQIYGKYMDSNKHMKKMPNIISYQGNAN